MRGEVRRTEEGRPTLPSHITVAELLDEWLAVRQAGLEPSTFDEYQRIAQHRIAPRLGHVRVKELRPLHVAKMFAALRQPGANRRGKAAKGLSETSLQHTHAHLDLEAATMSIAGRRTRVGYEMVDRAGTKTAAGARVVELDPATVDIMMGGATPRRPTERPGARPMPTRATCSRLRTASRSTLTT